MGVTPATPPSTYVNRDEPVSLRVVSGAKTSYIALCENDRGRFIKLSDGRSKLIVPASALPQLRAAVQALEDASSKEPVEDDSAEATEAADAPAPGVAGAPGAQATLLHGERFVSEGSKKFYLDLLRNNRGRFVKISMATTRRVSMILPEDALPLLREALDQLVELAPPETVVSDAAASSPHRITTRDGHAIQREIRVEGKRVVVESGKNRRGSYIRIIENGPMRMVVTLPHAALPQVIELLQEALREGDPAEDADAP